MSDPKGIPGFKHEDKFGSWLGYKALEVDRTKRTVRTYLKIREDHLSPSGRVHGGVISAFFDFSSGAAVFSSLNKGDICSTVELKVNYFYPLNLGDELEIRAEVVFRGKRLCVTHAYLRRAGDEKILGMASATFNLVSKEEIEKKRGAS